MKRNVLLVVLVLAGGTVAGGVGMASGSDRGVPAAGSAAANRASATAEAARLLGLVALPAGVVRSATEPPGDQHGLGEPTYDEATPNLVDANAWWTTTASPQAVLAYVAAHLPAGGEGLRAVQQHRSPRHRPDGVRDV
jgi:hypothetical protein